MYTILLEDQGLELLWEMTKVHVETFFSNCNFMTFTRQSSYESLTYIYKYNNIQVSDYKSTKWEQLDSYATYYRFRFLCLYSVFIKLKYFFHFFFSFIHSFILYSCLRIDAPPPRPANCFRETRVRFSFTDLSIFPFNRSYFHSFI